MAAIRQALLICALALPPAGATSLLHPRSPWRVAEAPLAPFEVTVMRATEWGQAVLWIDARSPAEFAAGHIPGAVPLDEANWDARFEGVVDAWTPERKVVVYCSQAGCAVSRHVAERLRQDLGSAEVYFLRGGYGGWKESRK